jgi:SAM-dependent methyltransferase
MNNQEEAHIASYKQQEIHLSSLQFMSRQEFLQYEETVDAWRHKRMMIPFAPFVKDLNWSWLTVGDAHGWDASRLMSMGAEEVTASDLSTIRLEHAKNEGIIRHYRAENAESMTAQTGEFDVVFCKEAFHHLPRPWIGLYEMIRVARRVVLMIEPRDWIIDKGPVTLSGPKGMANKLLLWVRTKFGIAPKPISKSDIFRLGDKPHYEEVGNFMFTISSREIEKVALGMDLPAIAFFALNDHFEVGLSRALAEESNPDFKRVQELLNQADRISGGGIGSSSMLLTAIFVEMPSPELQSTLAEAGWYFKTLGRNPYLNREAN